MSVHSLDVLSRQNMKRPNVLSLAGLAYSLSCSVRLNALNYPDSAGGGGLRLSPAPLRSAGEGNIPPNFPPTRHLRRLVVGAWVASTFGLPILSILRPP